MQVAGGCCGEPDAICKAWDMRGWEGDDVFLLGVCPDWDLVQMARKWF